jgi:hypothetical protein
LINGKVTDLWALPVQFALPYITRQIVYPDAEDFQMFLSKRSVLLTE